MELLRKYGVGITIECPIIKAGSDDFAKAADWTPQAGDVTISKDGGAAANITTLPTALTKGNGAVWQFQLSATEMQCGRMSITVADAATKAVKDQEILIATYGNASAMYLTDFSVANIPADLKAILSDANAATGFLKATGVIGRGTVTTGGSVTSVPTSAFTPNGVHLDQFKGRVIIFDKDTTTTALRGQATKIVSSSAASAPVFTVEQLTAAPASGDTFSVV